MFLAIDQGTSSTRAVLFDEKFHVLKITRRKFRQIYPREGWVEHSPEEIWNSVKETVEEILREYNWSDIKAIGITNQRETVIAWDSESGTPLYNAIVWQCRRTAKRSEHLKKEKGEFIRKRTGLVVDPYFSATKMEWMIQNVEEVKKALERGTLRFGTIDSFLAYKMTGKHVTDHSNASRTMLYSLLKGDWDDELLHIFGIPRWSLPNIVESAETIGETLWGIPLSGLIGDQQGALFGQGAFDKGELKLTMGTGSFILLNVGELPHFPEGGLLGTVAWKTDGKTTYAIEGSVFITGALIDWLISMGIFHSPEEISRLAESSSNGGVYLVPAFTGLGAPHWDPTARGLIIGISRSTSRENIARAAFESIAFSIKEIVDLMKNESGIEIKVLRVDGGVSKSIPLLKILSSSVGIEVERPKVLETTAKGAAMLASLGIGYYHLEDLRKFRDIDVSIEEQKELEEEFEKWKEAVERSKGWSS